MIFLLLVAFALSSLVAVALAKASSVPTPAQPSSDLDSADDVKQPVADTTGLNNPGYQRIAG